MRADRPKTGISVHHIIIDGKYWDLGFDSVKHTVSFNASLSQSAPHFTDQYIGAACVLTNKDDECRTYLVPKNDTHKWINETSIAGNRFDRVRNLNEYSKPVTRHVLGLEADNYRFAISANIYTYLPKIELIKKMGTSGKQFIRLVYIIKRNRDSSITFTFDTSIKNSSGSQDLRLDESKEVIGISHQYSNQDLGYIILFKEGEQVFWCWQWHENYNVSITVSLLKIAIFICIVF